MSAAHIVRDEPAANRYVVTVGTTVAGHTNYRDEHGADGVVRRVFTHTKVDEEFEGHGIAGELVRFALDDVRARGMRAVARCPFVKAWIERHQDYQDLVVA